MDTSSALYPLLKSLLETSVILTHREDGGTFLMDNPANQYVEGAGRHQGTQFCLLSRLSLTYAYGKPQVEVVHRVVMEEADLDVMTPVTGVAHFERLLHRGQPGADNKVTPITAARRKPPS